MDSLKGLDAEDLYEVKELIGKWIEIGLTWKEKQKLDNLLDKRVVKNGKRKRR